MNKINKNQLKDIPMKNYVILFLIILFSFTLVIYFFRLYNLNQQSHEDVSIIQGVLTEISYEDLDSFLKERNNTILYVCNTSSRVCDSFEKKFKSYVIDKYYIEKIVYFNVKKYDNNFLNKFITKYKDSDLKKKINKYPMFLIFNDGKIIDILSSSENNVITITKLDDFLKEYEFIE